MRIAALILLLIWAASPATAQPAPAPSGPPSSAPRPTPYRDLIGELLNPNAPAPRDEDEPDTAGKSRTAQDVEPSLAAPAGQSTPPPTAYAPAPRPQLDAPVYIDETGKTPDGAPALRDLAYDTRIRASFAAAENFQGPLDGGWTLVGADGVGLFALQLVDKPDRLEGVWRDLRRKGAIDASGLVEDIQRQGGELTLRFAAAPATVATLHGAGGGWSGELAEAGQSRKVTLRRANP